MKLNLDEYDKVITFISGLYQFEENEPFSQAALAVTDDEFFIYDDHRPTDKNNGEYHYVIKKRFKLSRIDFVLDETIKGNADLANYGRLYFYSKEIEDSFEFYYMFNERKQTNFFLKKLKSLGIPHTSKTTVIKANKF